MKNILEWLMKVLPPKTVVDAIFDFLQWIVKKTIVTWDDDLIDKLEEIKDLLYALIGQKRKSRP